MDQKYGLETIKLMMGLVHSRITKEEIKIVLQLAEYGINKDNIDGLYDILSNDSSSNGNSTPLSSQPLSEIDYSPPHTDEDPWAGIPRDPAYEPLPSSQTSSNSQVKEDSTFSDTTNSSTPSSQKGEKRTRDRFQFRSIHQGILNSAFMINPYPENDEKELLVEHCNEALERIKGRALRENEKMTILNINNWFNNRRKEKKRKVQEVTPCLPIQDVRDAHDIQDIQNTIPSFDVHNIVKEELISDQEDEF